MASYISISARNAKVVTLCATAYRLRGYDLSLICKKVLLLGPCKASNADDDK